VIALLITVLVAISYLKVAGAICGRSFSNIEGIGTIGTPTKQEGISIPMKVAI
jgi:hypothetical protein